MTIIFHATMIALEQSLTCALIASDIASDGILHFQSTDDVITEYAKVHRFTRVPLWDSIAGIPSHVAIVDLASGSIQRSSIVPHDLIAGTTPIGTAIMLLRDRSYYFVLVNEKIKKIVTRSDLNKLPVRIYLTTLITHLEGMLSSVIVEVLPDEKWMEFLSEKQKERVNNLFIQKREADFDTNLIDCTMLSDKSTIISKSTMWCQQLRIASRNQAERQAKDIRRLRDRLFHTLPPLSEETDTLRDHLFHGNQLTKVTDIQWLAEVVTTIDQWIDALNTAVQEKTTNDA